MSPRRGRFPSTAVVSPAPLAPFILHGCLHEIQMLHHDSSRQVLHRPPRHRASPDSGSFTQAFMSNQVSIPLVKLTKPLRKWGNAYGIIISREEARQMGLHTGDLVEADLNPVRHTRVTDLPTMHAGANVDYDEILARDLDARD